MLPNHGTSEHNAKCYPRNPPLFGYTHAHPSPSPDTPTPPQTPPHRPPIRSYPTLPFVTPTFPRPHLSVSPPSVFPLLRPSPLPLLTPPIRCPPRMLMLTATRNPRYSIQAFLPVTFRSKNTIATAYLYPRTRDWDSWCSPSG